MLYDLLPAVPFDLETTFPSSSLFCSYGRDYSGPGVILAVEAWAHCGRTITSYAWDERTAWWNGTIMKNAILPPFWDVRTGRDGRCRDAAPPL